MSINSNIYELAEGYLAGSLPNDEWLKLKDRLAADAEYATEFYEITDLIRSVEDNGKQKRFRSMLREVHDQQTRNPAKKIKLIELPAHIWRTAAVAASVAILTSTIAVWSLRPSIKQNNSQYNTISREMKHLKEVQARQQAQQAQLIENINKNTKPTPRSSDVKYTGTGFALTNDGYFVTAYHVINDGSGDGDSVYIQNSEGDYFKASVYSFNAKADIAILKVEKKGFRFGKGEVPYTFASGKTSLGRKIFTLGYPKDDLVYSEGYISSRNGYEGNAQQYTLELPAGHGQSGSPVVDEHGNVLGLLTGISGAEEANTYAVSSKALLDLLHTTLPDNMLHLAKTNKLGKLSRDKQIEKMEAYTFSVKVYKR
ncbi:MAG: serine protease [Bacteroidota bacterium]